MQVMTGGDGSDRVSKKRVGVGWGCRVGGTERARRGGEGRRRAVDPWGEGVRRRSGGAG
jgi:hypothetical protein